jgi:type IV fimbrial biogenesis protein FimT
MATADVAAVKGKGFTLIELMAALAILALLLLLGIPSFIAFLRNSEIRSTAESIINGLRKASAEATRRNSRVAFTLNGTNGSWQIRAISDPAADTDCTTLAPDVIDQFPAEEVRRGATVTTTPGGTTAVCFTGLGRVFNQGTGDHVRLIDIASSGASGGRPLRIIVDDPAPADPARPRGLRMCDPDPALAALTPPDPRGC